MPVALRRRTLLLGSAALAGTGLAGMLPGGVRAQDAPGRTNHALLVAVTEYPNLWQSEWLRGPNNDVIFARDYLLGDAPIPFAEKNVTVLATGLDIASAEPELAAIRAEMRRLAETVRPGDFVFLMFAGHGIEQPARNPEQEFDGRDQVFMPKDVQRMTRALGHWPNGYVDKDIRDDVTAIRQAGGLVWAVFDCCHSATITRNLELLAEGEKARKVSLADYDIPDDLWMPAARSTAGAAAAEPQSMFGPAGSLDAGDGLPPMVAFFAAQTVEETPEMPLPRGAEEPVQMGLFSFTLLSMLRAHPAADYRELGQAIHHAYLGIGRSRPTPLFEGALDNRVFSAEPRAQLPQWRIRGSGDARDIAAGQMHGIAPGSRLAVLPGPASGGADAFDAALASAIGVVEVAAADALRSRLRPVSGADQDLPAIALGDVPENAYALLIERVVEFELAVASPRVDGPHAARAAEIAAALEEIAGDDRLPMRLRLVPPGGDADVRFDLRSEAEVADLMRRQGGLRPGDAAVLENATTAVAPRLWLLDAGATLSLRSLERPHSLTLGPEAQVNPRDWLRESLASVYRATNLARLGGANAFGGDVEVTLTKVPDLDTAADAGEPLALHRTAAARPGEVLHLRVQNNGGTTVDVNLLYIDANHGITWMPLDFDGSRGVPARLRGRSRNDPPAVYDEAVVQFEPTSFGRERVVVVVTGAEAQDNPLDLSFLEQGGVATRSLGAAPATGFGAVLEQMAGAAATRGGSSLAARRQAASGQRGAVLVYAIDNLPED